MTKTAAREAIRRARQALRDMETALKLDDTVSLDEAIGEAFGSVAIVEEYKDEVRTW